MFMHLVSKCSGIHARPLPAIAACKEQFSHCVNGGDVVVKVGGMKSEHFLPTLFIYLSKSVRLSGYGMLDARSQDGSNDECRRKR